MIDTENTLIITLYISPTILTQTFLFRFFLLFLSGGSFHSSPPPDVYSTDHGSLRVHVLLYLTVRRHVCEGQGHSTKHKQTSIDIN